MKEEEQKKNPVSGWEARLPDMEDLSHRKESTISKFSEHKEKMQEDIKDSTEEFFVVKARRPEDACGYTRVPLAIIAAYHNLKDETKLTYLALRSYAFDKQVCWPSAETLSKDLGFHKATVYRHLDELRKEGLIHRESVYEKTPFRSREYIKTNTFLLDLNEDEIKKASTIFSSRKKRRGHGIVFTFKDPQRRGGDIFINNVFLRGYRSLTSGSKLLFILIHYLASCGIVLNMTDIATCLSKDTRTVRRYINELIDEGLLERDIGSPPKGKKNERGDVHNRIFICGFSEEEVQEYLKKYNPQYLVADKIATDPVDNLMSSNNIESRPSETQYLVADKIATDPVDKRADKIATDPVDNQYLGGLKSANDPLGRTKLRLEGGQNCDYKNKGYIEEERYNVTIREPCIINHGEQKEPKEIGGVINALFKNLPKESESSHHSDLRLDPKIKRHLNTAYYLAEELDDLSSLPYYLKVCRIIYDSTGSYYVLYLLLSQVKHKRAMGDLRKTPAAYFAGSLKAVAKEKGFKL